MSDFWFEHQQFEKKYLETSKIFKNEEKGGKKRDRQTDKHTNKHHNKVNINPTV